MPDESVDAGPVLESTTVPIYPSDSLETLENRMHQAEHRTLVQALLRVIEGDED